MRIWTIGHSTRKIDIVLSLLQKNEIKLVADVRMYPGSKRYPQFGCEALAKSLGEAGIRYEHFPELGGRLCRGYGAPRSGCPTILAAMFELEYKLPLLRVGSSIGRAAPF